MAAFAGALFLVLGFIILLKLFSLIEHAKHVFVVANKAFSDIRNPAIDDEIKEKALQAHTIQLFRLFIILTLGAAAALFLPVGVIWLLAKTGIISFAEVMTLTLSWEFLVGSTVVIVMAMILIRKRRHVV